MAQTSCWEFMKCSTKEKCPAFPDKGRSCWEVAGTLCRGEKQGTAEQKRQDCVTLCKFMEGVLGGTIA